MGSLARLAAVVVLTAAAGLTVPAPASAAACSSASGVTVVVDFHELGGGPRQACDADGAGETAATQFGHAGFVLDRVQRQPGFVCRVNNLPSKDDDPCVNTPPANAYWGVWWSDGKSGSWNYSSQGVDSLKVPDGGYVALSWNGSSTKSPPGATPRTHAAAPPSSPSPPSPSASASSGGAGTSSGSSGSGSPRSAAPSSSASAQPEAAASKKAAREKRRRAAAKSTAPAPTPTTSSATAAPGSADGAGEYEPASAEPGTDDDGLPVWLAPALIVLLFAGAGGTALARRRSGAGGS